MTLIEVTDVTIFKNFARVTSDTGKKFKFHFLKITFELLQCDFDNCGVSNIELS